MSDKDELMANLSRLETDLADTYAVIGSIKDVLADTMAENSQLRMENDRLRLRLDELEHGKEQGAHSSNLFEIYEEGFHVCHTYYGKVLESGENCILCQEVLFR